MGYQAIDQYLSSDLLWNGHDGNWLQGHNDPKILVMHATVGSKDASLSRFRDRHESVSAHYIIDRDGTVSRVVRPSDQAFHAGRSAWGGYTDINDHSIGIELVNRNDGLDPYPDAQYAAAVQLAKELVQQYHIPDVNLVTHAQVAVPKGRKTDPRGFPMERFKYDVYSAGADWGNWGRPPVEQKPPQSNTPPIANSGDRWGGYFSVLGKDTVPALWAELKRLLGV